MSFVNPYELATSVIGRTLEVLDDDKLIPFYGFGDCAQITPSSRIFSDRMVVSRNSLNLVGGARCQVHTFCTEVA